MKITKKLAKEIFKGDFSNVDVAELQKVARQKKELSSSLVSLRGLILRVSSLNRKILMNYKHFSLLTHQKSHILGVNSHL